MAVSKIQRKQSLQLLLHFNVKIGANVFVIPITSNYSKDELLLYAGNQDRLIVNIGGYKKKFTNYILLNSSSSVKSDFIEAAKIDQSFIEKAAVTTLFNAFHSFIIFEI
ncbi:hypothetical protein WUBG_18421 [Wuchereria bancrofti]|uniref:Uncharacterized protein n=1 Tax=Wuchereria bancrofti TaxID=6293 RepID=J9E195_WUCBA|nr:hypothetical protein WUBG_18421 [Wuchereria bancrofti]VDM13351.1 unnamed protein product [Wuchereria bancrofti]